MVEEAPHRLIEIADERPVEAREWGVHVRHRLNDVASAEPGATASTIRSSGRNAPRAEAPLLL
jgi:hypothetical protein